MPTKFTPITNGAPQSGGEIDNLISAIQSMRQMRKQMKDEEWQAQLRAYQEKQQARTLMEQGKADEAELQAATQKKNITSMLDTPKKGGRYTIGNVDELALKGDVSKLEYAKLIEGASDYIPDSQRMISLSKELYAGMPAQDVLTLADKHKVSYAEARSLLGDIERDVKPPAGAGGGTDGTGTGTGTGKITVGEAEGKNWKKQYRGAGRTQPNGISVRAYGNDASPTMVVHRDDGLQIEKKRDKYVAVYRENGKRIEVVLTVKGDELVGSLPGKNKIKPAIKKALDAAYVEWETKSIDAQGKITDYPFYGEK